MNLIDPLGTLVITQCFFDIYFIVQFDREIIIAFLFIFYLKILFLLKTAFIFSKGFQFIVVY
jgi:hypothetical protein